MTTPAPFARLETLYADASGALYCIRNLNLNQVGAAGLVPTRGGGVAYVTGSAQLVLSDAVGTLTLETVVSNESPNPSAQATKKHPDDNASIYGSDRITPGMPLEHAWFGVRVTAAIGSDIFGDVWISMKPATTSN